VGLIFKEKDIIGSEEIVMVEDKKPKDTLLGIASILLLIVAFLLLSLPALITWSVYPYYIYLDLAIAIFAIILGAYAYWGKNRKNFLGFIGFILGIIYTVLITAAFIIYISL